MKRLMLLTTFVAAVMLTTESAEAGKEKYTFENVVIDGRVVEIEASVKETKKGSFSTCSYYADDYSEYLGYYTAPVSAGDTAEEVRAHCVEHFDDRTHD